MVGGDAPPERTLYYRAFYCPVAHDKRLAIAKTVLVPGQRGTPEYDYVQHANVPPQTMHPG